MTTLDPRGFEAAAEVFGDSIGCPEITERAGVCHGCKRRAEQIITAYLAITQPTITTVEELKELGNGTVIRDKYGDVCEKRSGWWIRYEPGLIDTASMVHSLPARVIWKPQP